MRYLALVFSCCLLITCNDDPIIHPSFTYHSKNLDGVTNGSTSNVSIQPTIVVTFSNPIDINTINSALLFSGSEGDVPYTFALSNQDSTLTIQPSVSLQYLKRYDFVISNQLQDIYAQNLSQNIQFSFNTTFSPNDKFPRISNDELLTLVQKNTFSYFWEFGHPVSGMARERNTSGDLVTSGGSGFGIMSIIVAAERGFITKEEAFQRIAKITDFLTNKAERYHGAFAHWINGMTGKTIPFSQKDNGGDIVETSFLIAGLLCAAEYFNDNNNAEYVALQTSIFQIYEDVEWDWYTKNGGSVMYWHWSPNFNWDINLALRGWNEALIVYVLAAGSPTHPINKNVYDNGWARNGNMKNGKAFYGNILPLGEDLGGPLFFSHYSFLGLDPRNLKDQYADYNAQTINHSKINHAYCVANPRKYVGYSDSCWGLTASDTNNGYTAHSPTNDRGVITPTAALSSMPYTPNESIKALEFFYYTMGDKLFKQYGFVDAFNLTNLWFANGFLAIDQGPILVMIENHRTQLIWNTTMKNKYIKDGLDKLQFTY